ncbi:hypothetical protein ACJJTC_003759, partial [Scirpophaga incertulas]
VISLRGSNALGLGPAVYATVRTRPALGEDALGDELDDPDDLADGDDDLDDGLDDGGDSPPDLLPPVGLKAIMLSGTTAVVYWTDPTLPKGQAATDGRRYVVRWTPAGTARTRSYNASDLNCMLDELRPATAYDFQVKLIKGQSAPCRGTCCCCCCRCCCCYVVRWTPAGTARTRSYNASDLNCMLDELRPATAYDFQVKLIKGGRESQWSMIVSNTTLEAPPGSPPRDVRVQPAADAPRALDVSWAPPARPNGIITGYVVTYAVRRGSGAEEWAAVTVSGERARARLERLRPGAAYWVRVQAANARGWRNGRVPAESSAAGGGGLAASAWLWASAGGALAVLALAAALALSLCCRRSADRGDSTYQKASASAAIKPPDLWIHHDQMELKHLDTKLHASASKSTYGQCSKQTPLCNFNHVK